MIARRDVRVGTGFVMEDSLEPFSMAQIEDDNRRLRRLLDDSGSPKELRHRTRNTLRILRTIVRKSAETGRELSDYVAHLEDRLDSLGRVQATADQYGYVDLHKLLSDELHAYTLSEGDRFSLTGPMFRLEPRAAQTFGLAVHELAVNAVEHGAISSPHGDIAISWAASSGEDGTILTFSWEERTRNRAARFARQGFGTEVLTKMLAYELGATTSLDLGRADVRCEIRFPVTPDVGVLLDRESGTAGG